MVQRLDTLPKESIIYAENPWTENSNQYVPKEGMDSFGKIESEMIGQSLISTKYNSMGEIFLQGQKRFDWDPWGRLLKVTDGPMTWEASYDALGRRLQTRYKADQGSTLTTTSFYDPEEEFGELGVKYGNKTFWKFYGPNVCDAVSDGTGAVVYLMQDALRQLVGVTTDKGIQFSEQVLSAYGPQTDPTIPTDLLTYAQSLSWHSKSQDPTGLIWMGARYYDPKGGRFISPDPVSYPVSMDLYVYAGGDPVNYFDPDGRLKQAINGPISAKLIRPYDFGNKPLNKRDFFGGTVLGAVKFASSRAMELADLGSALCMEDFYDQHCTPWQEQMSKESINNYWGRKEGFVRDQIVTHLNFDPLSTTARERESSVYSSLVVVDFIRPSLNGSKFRSFTKSNYRHNLKVLTGGSPPRGIHTHHVFPQELTEYFAKKGINVHEPQYLTWWEASSHQSNSFTYNALWKSFIRNNSEATKLQILEEGKKIMIEYGIKTNY